MQEPPPPPTRLVQRTPRVQYKDSPSVAHVGKRVRCQSPMVAVERAEEAMPPPFPPGKYGRVCASRYGNICAVSPRSAAASPQPEAATANAETRARLANSTSSIFASNTISSPDASQIILCMASVLQTQIGHDVAAREQAPAAWDIFNEDEAAVAGLSAVPSLDEMYCFIHSIFQWGKFSPECNIIALVYINRVLSQSDLVVHRRNWKGVVLASLILSQKVWDDKCLATSVFSKICPQFNKEQVVRLEAKFLEMLQYNAIVPRSLYTHYFFELRSLFQILMGHLKMQVSFDLEPLTMWRARQMEVYAGSLRVSLGHGKEGKLKGMTLEDATYCPKGRFVSS
ncbi:unnamed protein product [Chrysoparadoxa australica]